MTINQKRTYKRAKKITNKAVKSILDSAIDAQGNTDPVETATVSCLILACAGLTDRLNKYLDNAGVDTAKNVLERLKLYQEMADSAGKEFIAQQIPFIDVDETLAGIAETYKAISGYMKKRS